ncbi:MurT ligase domain-containing protein [Patescibacteria group bacterium]
MYLLTKLITKFTYWIIKTLRLGAGYTWPGHLALKLNKDILRNTKLHPSKGFIFIAGTNGKTTTSKLISHILRKKGLRVVTNRSGANLLNGIVSSLLLEGSHSDIGVFEVDEFALPNLLEQVTPKVLLLLNLSRDQLDRYGEIDIIFDSWKETISKLDGSTHIIFDATQEIFKGITNYEGKLTEFSITRSLIEDLDLFGEHNSKNVKAALSVVKDFGVNEKEALETLKDFKPAYGRGETIEYKNTSFQIFLAKNPASFNNNLGLLLSKEVDIKAILFILNDNIPDGRYVSWIYDIDPNSLKEACRGREVFVSGKRYLDMAVRLMYAEIQVGKGQVFENLGEAVESLTEKKEILVFPNYSAMLEIRKILTGKKIL